MDYLEDWMRYDAVIKAVEEAERFQKLAYLLHKCDKNDWEITGSKLSGAVRRASMDLTRALAEMRRP
jgi:hypothetical protein